MAISIAILGAGPAGMAAAMELYKENKKFLVVEKTLYVGGLATTYKFEDFLTDNGPHRFFSKNQYLYDFIADILGDKWIKVSRFTRFYVDGKFYRYPLEMKNLLTTLPFTKGVKFFLGLIYAKIRYLGNSPSNFEEYVVAKFGRPLANFNMINYTEKIWGLPCTELSVDWAKQRIQGLGVFSLLKKLFSKRGGPKTLVDEFYYPTKGTGLIYSSIKSIIEKENQFLMGTEPTKINHSDGCISSIMLSDGTEITPDTLISSIPITEFLQLLDPKPPDEIMHSAEKLIFRSQVYLFITLNKPTISPDQWIYFPDSDIPFGRISEMKNFSSEMAPENKTSLFIEFFCWKNDEIWNADQDKLLELCLPWFAKFDFFSKNDIEKIYHIKRQNAYPVYTLDYFEHLSVVKSYLDSITNLIYIGRQGRFKYTNQDHSLEMGILAAKQIIDETKIDMDHIGAESEYFEKGAVK